MESNGMGWDGMGWDGMEINRIELQMLKRINCSGPERFAFAAVVLSG